MELLFNAATKLEAVRKLHVLFVKLLDNHIYGSCIVKYSFLVIL